MKKYRAHLPAWIFIGGLSALPWLVFWVSSAHRIDFVALAVAIAVSGFAIAWLSSFCIIITPTELTFRSLFRGKRTLRHDEIKRVRLTWKLWQTGKGPLHLVVEPLDASRSRTLEINAKVFSKEAIDAVLDLGARVAEVDDGGLRDGVFLRTLRDRKKPSAK